MKTALFEQIILEFKHRKLFYGIERDILDVISPNIDKKEIIAISGVRRCGKTTLMHQIIRAINKPENILYINFEDERLLDFGVLDFDTLLEEFYRINEPEGKIYIFFDEIQEIKQWEKWVRRTYDTCTSIKFFITGSSSALLSSEFSTLLTGRNVSYTLYPFSFREYLRFNTAFYSIEEIRVSIPVKAKIKKYMKQYLENGGFPTVAGEGRIDLLQQYFRDILYRDIVRRYQVRDVKLLEELFVFLFTNISNRISYNSLKNTFKMGLDTVKEYLGYGIASHLFFEHLFFSYSLKEAYHKNRKIYAIDTGLRNSLVFKFSKDTGKLAENIFFLESKQRFPDVFYYNETNEVDFVIKKRDNTLDLFNICYTDEIPEREIKGLHECKKNFDSRIRNMYIITKDLEDTAVDIHYVPLWKWLLL